MNTIDTESNTRWSKFYKVAGAAALLIVLAGIMDIIISSAGGEVRANSAIAVTEWFALFESNRIAALCNLGLINIITITLGLPVYLALYNVHRRVNPGFAALSAVVFFIGAAIYISSNTVFSMLALSGQYIAASEAEKVLLEAAGRAALAQGADLTPGTFMGLIFTQIAGLIMAWVMLRGGFFSKWNAWFGLFGFSCMIVFFTLAAFAPEQFSVAMLISMFGGLALIAYQIMLALKLFRSGAVSA